MTEQTELEQKKKFALALLKCPDNAYQAAREIFPENVSKALLVSSKWPIDPYVKECMEAITSDVGDMAFLPTKADLARAIWSMANSDRSTVDDKLKALRLYADVRGFIEKQAINVNNGNVTTNQVMLVQDHGTTANWEEQLAAQQLKLITEADAPRTH